MKLKTLAGIVALSAIAGCSAKPAQMTEKMTPSKELTELVGVPQAPAATDPQVGLLSFVMPEGVLARADCDTMDSDCLAAVVDGNALINYAHTQKQEAYVRGAFDDGGVFEIEAIKVGKYTVTY